MTTTTTKPETTTTGERERQVKTRTALAPHAHGRNPCVQRFVSHLSHRTFFSNNYVIVEYMNQNTIIYELNQMKLSALFMANEVENRKSAISMRMNVDIYTEYGR